MLRLRGGNPELVGRWFGSDLCYSQEVSCPPNTSWMTWLRDFASKDQRLASIAKSTSPRITKTTMERDLSVTRTEVSSSSVIEPGTYWLRFGNANVANPCIWFIPPPTPEVVSDFVYRDPCGKLFRASQIGKSLSFSLCGIGFPHKAYGPTIYYWCNGKGLWCELSALPDGTVRYHMSGSGADFEGSSIDVCDNSSADLVNTRITFFSPDKGASFIMQRTTINC